MQEYQIDIYYMYIKKIPKKRLVRGMDHLCGGLRSITFNNFVCSSHKNSKKKKKESRM